MSLQKALEQYESAPVMHRPLKLVHHFEYPEDSPLAGKMEAITQKLQTLRDKGFGGVVTNVDFNDNYLQSDEQWFLLRHTFQSARKLGMRTWIYDENAYPSGSAGGLTLEGHPEWQAQGLAMQAAVFHPGERIRVSYPYGHIEVAAAYAYKCDDLENISDAAAMHPWKVYPAAGQTGIDDVNDSGETVTAVLFVRKNMYEGTHAVHNVAVSRRYIDVSNPEAVAAFARNTYVPYFEKLAEDGPIEAIFTDEPSYMGAYINLNLYPKAIQDPYDEQIPLLPCVNWGADVANRFQADHGIELKQRLVFLFGGKGETARKVRRQFYQTLSNLYEEAFFIQLSRVSDRYHVPFSGHVLLEDDIRYHPVFEGNYFSTHRHMHFPGIDMLHGIPERIREDAFTPKLISSVAHTYGRKHVMSEISAHAQGGKVTPEQFLGCMYIQYVLGVDVFTSYFSETQVPDDVYLAYNDAVGRIDAIMGGGKHIADVALYYPIETIQEGTLPHGREIYEELDMNLENTQCWNSVKEIQNALLAAQLDFDYLDLEALQKCEPGEGSFAAPGGESFRVLVIPACRMNPELETVIRRFRAANICVLIQESPLFSVPETMRELRFGNSGILAERIRGEIHPALCLESAPEILYLCRDNENGRSILLVNTHNAEVKVHGTLNGKATLYDPLENRMAGSICDTADIRFNPYQAWILALE